MTTPGGACIVALLPQGWFGNVDEASASVEGGSW